MGADPALSGLLREFAALCDEDRAMVLSRLGQAERERLQLILSGREGPAPSLQLASLVDQCRADAAPAGLTARAAAALLEAVDATGTAANASAGLPVARGSLGRRTLGFLRGRA